VLEVQGLHGCDPAAWLACLGAGSRLTKRVLSFTLPNMTRILDVLRLVRKTLTSDSFGRSRVFFSSSPQHL
jgi:hypothetical protein